MFKFLLISSLIFSFAFFSDEPIKQGFVPNTVPTATPINQKDADELDLDKDEICTPCPPGYRANEDSDCDINMLIAVFAAESDDKNAVYQYTVSGGRIVGEGAKVSWDLTGAAPGTYQISVDIENKISGLQKRKSKTVTVNDQACGDLCVCPTLSVVAPAGATKVGETITFTANVSGGSGEMITYDWTVSDGEIIEGQGTPIIKVATTSKMAGKTIKATVNIGGVCEECNKTESAISLIAKAKSVKK